MSDFDDLMRLQKAERDLIVRQYRRIAGAINELFSALSQRTQGEDWKADGVGRCAFSPYAFDDGMIGIAAHLFPALWRTKTQAVGLVTGVNACPHHARGTGCVLGDIKPARCLRYVEQSDAEIEPLAGMSAPQLEILIQDALDTVMIGGECTPDLDTFLVHPERNEPFVHECVESFSRITRRVESFPVVAQAMGYRSAPPDTGGSSMIASRNRASASSASVCA